MQPTFSYFSDSPLAATEFDIYDRRRFANKLAAILMNLETKSTVIGIEGAWGSGKSTFLNFLEDEICQLRKKIETETDGNPIKTKTGTDGETIKTKTGTDGETIKTKTGTDGETNNKDIFFRFNPWWFDGRGNLQFLFFLELARKISLHNEVSFASENKEKIIASLTIIASVALVGGLILAAPTTVLPAVAMSGPLGAILAKLVESAKAFIPDPKVKESSLYNKPLYDAKIDIENVLEADGRFIWVFIDDLDRLNPTEALEMVSMVRGLGQLANVRYILAYDREQLEDRLAKSTNLPNVGGRDYLDKIVQVSYDLPNPVAWRLRIEMRTWLEKFTEDIELNGDFEELIMSFVGTLIKTPRDLKRVLNGFQTVIISTDKNLYPPDLLALEILRLEYPRLYEEIKNHKNLLSFHSKDTTLLSSDELNKRMSEIIDQCCGPKIFEKEQAKKLLVFLYPKVAGESELPKDVNSPRFPAGNFNSFDAYFERGLESYVLTVEELEKLELSIKKDEDTLFAFLQEIHKKPLEDVLLNSREQFFYNPDSGHGINSRLRLVTAWIYENPEIFNDTFDSIARIIRVFLKIAEQKEFFEPIFLDKNNFETSDKNNSKANSEKINKSVYQNHFIEAIGRFLASFIRNKVVRFHESLNDLIPSVINQDEGIITLTIMFSFLKMQEKGKVTEHSQKSNIFVTHESAILERVKNHFDNKSIEIGLLLPFCRAWKNIEGSAISVSASNYIKKYLGTKDTSAGADKLINLLWAAAVSQKGKPIYPTSKSPKPTEPVDSIDKDLFLFIELVDLKSRVETSINQNGISDEQKSQLTNFHLILTSYPPHKN